MVSTDSNSSVKLFAHFIWNAAIFTADQITSGAFEVEGQSVLELGAGAGLPGILAALHGAVLVVLTDYDSAPLIANLRRNVEANIPLSLLPQVKVEGHVWGSESTHIIG